MKKTLSIIGLGASMLVALSSCSHNHGDTLGYEEATPMSELAIGDSELPPWVFEGDDSYQIPAGDRTPEVDRNHYATPEPGESMAVSNGLTGQKQPAVAHDDTVVDSHVADDFDPYAMPTGTTTATTAATPATPATPVAYKVRPGDNLYEIAKRSNTTIAQIRKDSGIKGDIIHPGQIIKVRFTPKGYKADKKKATPTTTTYVVKKGDMLAKVAARHGITTAALLKANNLTMAQAAKVRPGTKIVIPGKTSTVSKKNTKAKSSKKKSRR